MHFEPCSFYESTRDRHILNVLKIAWIPFLRNVRHTSAPKNNHEISLIKNIVLFQKQTLILVITHLRTCFPYYTLEGKIFTLAKQIPLTALTQTYSNNSNLASHYPVSQCLNLPSSRLDIPMGHVNYFQ